MNNMVNATFLRIYYECTQIKPLLDFASNQLQILGHTCPIDQKLWLLHNSNDYVSKHAHYILISLKLAIHHIFNIYMQHPAYIISIHRILKKYNELKYI